MRATYWRRDRRAKQRKLVLPINGLQASGISTLTGLAAALNVPSFFRCTNSVAESTRTPAERQAEERVLSKALLVGFPLAQDDYKQWEREHWDYQRQRGQLGSVAACRKVPTDKRRPAPLQREPAAMVGLLDTSSPETDGACYQH